MFKQRMHSVDYNTMLSLIDMINVNISGQLRRLNIGNIKVLPSYPRDLSEYKKPSIIVQRVNTQKSLIGFGGFIGQYYDKNDNTKSDIHGKLYEITMQLDVVSDNNTQCSLLTSLLSDDIIGNITNHRYNLFDYTQNPPIQIGYYDINRDIDIMPLDTDSGHKNNDYINAIRFDITVVQLFKPSQEYIDLNKWLKHTQIINGG